MTKRVTFGGKVHISLTHPYLKMAGIESTACGIWYKPSRFHFKTNSKKTNCKDCLMNIWYNGMFDE